MQQARRVFPARLKKLAPILLYAITFLIILSSTAVNNNLDSINESTVMYNVFIQYSETGEWSNVSKTTLSSSLYTSCLTATYIPAMITRAFGIDSDDDRRLFYRYYVIVLTALLPVVLYCIMRKYTSTAVAFALSLVLATSFYVMYPISLFRENVALIFQILLVYLILRANIRIVYRVTLILLATVGLVISHYGTAFVTVIILTASIGIGTLFYIQQRTNLKKLIYMGIVAITIMVLAFSWYGIANSYTVSAGKTVTTEIAKDVIASTTTTPEIAKDVITSTPTTPEIAKDVITSTTTTPEIAKESAKETTPTAIKNRQTLLDTLFFKNWNIISTSTRIHLVSIWIAGCLIFIITMLLYKKKKITAYLSTTSILIIFATILLPSIAVFYGISRAMYTCLPILLLAVAVWYGKREKNKAILIFSLLFSAIQYLNWNGLSIQQ